MEDNTLSVQLTPELKDIFEILGVEPEDREHFLFLFLGLALRNYITIARDCEIDLKKINSKSIMSLQIVYDRLGQKLSRAQCTRNEIHFHGDVHVNLGVQRVVDFSHLLPKGPLETRANLPAFNFSFPEEELDGPVLDFAPVVVDVLPDMASRVPLNGDTFSVSRRPLTLFPLSSIPEDSSRVHEYPAVVVSDLAHQNDSSQKVFKDAWIEVNGVHTPKRAIPLPSVILMIFAIIFIALSAGFFYFDRGVATAGSSAEGSRGSAMDASGLDPPK